MAIVKMLKLNLIGMSYDKARILDLLAKTASVELQTTSEIENTFTAGLSADSVMIAEDLARAKKCVAFFSDRLEKCKKEPYYPKDCQSTTSGFFLSFEEFISSAEKVNRARRKVEIVEQKEKQLVEDRGEIVKLNNQLSLLVPYLSIDCRFSSLRDTENAKVYFGLIKTERISELKGKIADCPYTDLTVRAGDGANSVIMVVSLKEYSEMVGVALSELGFTACPFTQNKTPKQLKEELEKRVHGFIAREKSIEKELCANHADLREIKIYADYLKFLSDKCERSQGFRETETTFVLQGYVPEPQKQVVLDAIENDGVTAYVEFSEPTEEDTPPTLLKNNPIIRQTEFITEMYSVPSYRELDPSKLVFFFFMLFMGVIMADVGYGVLMIGIGLLLASRIKIENGAKRLWNIIAIGGVFTIIFGALFNSYFGAKLPYVAPLPSPVPEGNGTDGLMTVLLLCLGLGVIQLGTGYLFKAINDFKRKDIPAGIFDGLVWVIFFVGLIFAAFNFLIGYLMPTATIDQGLFSFFETMTMPGIIMVAGAVLVAALTAGRNEKGFGKFSKGFGAVYGIINLLSDILSYARLFGLMLSGMIIASTFNDLGLGIISGGGIGYVLGGLVILVGHVFNIAMNVLGAYIHDSRLQYIEFFSKFYTGEGRKFIPFGSEFDYVYIVKK